MKDNKKNKNCNSHIKTRAASVSTVRQASSKKMVVISLLAAMVCLLAVVAAVSISHEDSSESDAAVGSTFTYTYEGVAVTYQVLTESGSTGTVQVGNTMPAIVTTQTGAVVIPSTVTSGSVTYAVVGIANNAFSSCKVITSVTIPSGVTSIGAGVFGNCYSLTSIAIPSGVTSIGYNAFINCYALTSIAIPSGVTSIKENTFSCCYALTSVTISSTVTAIGDYAFNECYALSSVTIPSGVTSINTHTFYGCSALSSVTIPSSVTYIGAYAFDGCSALSSVNIPSTVTAIWDYAFHGCSALSSVTIPSGVSSIRDYAFYGCSALSSVTISSGVTLIGGYAFYGCSALSSVTIPSTMVRINTYAFYGCSALSSVTIPSSVLAIDPCAFQNCYALHFIEIQRTTNFSVLDTNCFNTQCKIGTNVKTTLSINSNTYFGTTIRYLSSTATSAYTASGTTSGFAWTITDGDLVITSGTGALAATSSDAHWLGSDGKYYDGVIRTVTINEGVNITSIGDYAFNGCKSLTSITIPSGVTSIGQYAFNGCYALASITIPSGVTSIGQYAFNGCYALASITIPSGVTSIANYTFASCSALTSITIPSIVTSIGTYAFYRCYVIKSIIIPSGVTSIGASAFRGCSSVTSFTIPTGVTSIGEFTFSGCSAATSITIPSGVTSIGQYAFYYCSAITSITIPSGVTSIKSGMLSRCSALTSVTIPSGVTSIADTAFHYCSALTSITLPDGLSITENAFTGCDEITDVYVTLSGAKTTYGVIDTYFDTGSTWKLTGMTVTVQDLILQTTTSTIATGTIAGISGNHLVYYYNGTVTSYTYSSSWSLTSGSVAVVFDPNGTPGSVYVEYCATGGSISMIPDVFWVYGFPYGWFTSASFGDQVTSSTVFSSNTAVYAALLSYYAADITYENGTLLDSIITDRSYYGISSGSYNILSSVDFVFTVKADTHYTLDAATVSSVSGVSASAKTITCDSKDSGTYDFTVGGAVHDTYVVTPAFQAGTVLDAVTTSSSYYTESSGTYTVQSGVDFVFTVKADTHYTLDAATVTTVSGVSASVKTVTCVSKESGSYEFTVGGATHNTYAVTPAFQAGTVLDAVTTSSSYYTESSGTYTVQSGVDFVFTVKASASYVLVAATVSSVSGVSASVKTVTCVSKESGSYAFTVSGAQPCYSVTPTYASGVVLDTVLTSYDKYTYDGLTGTYAVMSDTDFSFSVKAAEHYTLTTATVTTVSGVSVTGLTVTCVHKSSGSYAFEVGGAGYSTYAVTASQGTGTTITFTTPATYGTDYTFTAVKDTGYTKGTLEVSVTIGGVTYALGSPTGDTYTITGTYILGAVVITTESILPDTYTVTKVQGTGTTITFTTPATYGTNYTFTAVKNTGYTQGTLAVSVTIGGVTYALGSPTGDTYTIAGTSILGAVVITAAASPDTYAVTKVQGTGTTITFTTPATYGTDYTFTAVKDTGYTQGTLSVSVTIGGTAYTLGSPTGDTYTIAGTSILGAVVITTASILPDTYAVTKVQGTGTTITFTTPATYGTDYTFTAVKDTGYTQGTLGVSVTIGGVTYALGSPTGDTYTITGTSILGAVVITTASILPDTYAVTKVQGTGTMITFTTPATYGTDYTFTAVKDTGYTQGTLSVSVTIGGTAYTLGSPTGDTYTIAGTSILGAVVITTAASPDTYAVTASQGTGTTITSATPATYGTDYTFTAVKDTGYTQGTLSVSVTIGGTAYTLGSPTGDTYTIAGTSILGAVVITTASILPDTYAVTKVQGTGTTITFTTPATYGTDYTFTAVKDTGYTQGTLGVSVTIGGVTYALGSPTGDTYTITGTSILGAVVITTASILPDTYAVTKVQGTGTTITFTTPATYGTDYTFTAVKDTGYDQGTLSVSVTIGGTAYTLGSPTGDTYTITGTSILGAVVITTGDLDLNIYTVSGILTVTGGTASNEGVTITLDTTGTDYTATTGTGGAYTILNVPYGTTGDIKASITGYHQTVTPSVTAINADMTGKDLTLMISQYTVSFDGNGSTSGSMPQMSMTYGTEYVLTSNAFFKSGSAFIGWSLSDSATIPTYSNRDSVVNLTAVSGGNVILYAVWEDSKYTVEFNGNGGTGYMPDQYLSSGAAVRIDVCVYSFAGKTFLGWDTDSSADTVMYTDMQTVKDLVSAGYTEMLYAVWSATGSSYTVTFDGNGGTGYMSDQNFASGEAGILIQNVFAKSGSTFQGWSTALNGPVVYTDGQTVRDIASAGGTVTLYAVWTATGSSYTVTFLGNGGTGYMPIQNFTVGTAKALEQNVFAKSGSTFQGWSTALNGPVVYTDCQTVKDPVFAGGTVTLYAVWTATGSSYTVIFNGNGGTGYMPIQNFTSGAAKALQQNVFSESGNTFQGWSAVLNGPVVYTDGQTVRDLASATGTVTLYAVWSATGSSYTVIFDSNNGTGYMPAQNFTADVAKSLEQNIFVNPGSTFQGWSVVLNGPVVYTDGQIVRDLVSATGTVTLYAVWSATGSSYTVTFNGNGGTGYMPVQNFTSGTAKSLEQNVFSKSGSTFQGWSTALNGPVLYTDGQTVKDLVSAGGTVTFYAVWTLNASSYTVTFNGNGGTGYMPIQNFTSGAAKALQQNVFSKSGSTFQGWSAVLNGPVVYTDGQKIVVTANTTLFAVWSSTGSSYTVTFDANGGTGYMPDQNFTLGTAKPLEQNIFVDPGSTFQGWSAVLNGPVVYTDGQTVRDLASATSTVTLYAVWTATGSSYTVTFNGNGGTGYMPDQNFTIGTPRALAQNLFANSGSTFQGWATELNGPVVYTDGQTVRDLASATGMVTLYAVWSPDASSYTVTFNGNGGTGYMPDQNFTTGTAKALEQNVFTRSGYTFQGWATSSGGEISYVEGQKIDAAAGMTLFAVWNGTASSYTVTFNGNNGTGYMPAQNFTTGTAKTLEQNIFTKTGYRFTGWSTTPDGAVAYSDDQVVNDMASAGSTAVLYAVWEESYYDATFVGNYSGSTYSVMISEATGGTYVLPADDPERSGYTFDGWYTAETGGSQITASTAVDMTADAMFYAHWTEASTTSNYTVSFSSGPGYSVSCDGSTTVESGGSLIFTVSVSSGYVLNSVTATGCTISHYSSGYILSDITADTYVSISVSVQQSTPDTPSGTDGGNDDADDGSYVAVGVAAGAIIATLVASLMIFFKKD